jgi:hypothetical protein
VKTLRDQVVSAGSETDVPARHTEIDGVKRPELLAKCALQRFVIFVVFVYF